jgi:Trk K+ transport system NAD-binding subunit
VVCGADSTSVRLVEELRRVDETVVAIVHDMDTDLAQEMVDLGARLVLAPRPHEGALREAGIEYAKGVAFVEADDVTNVHAALTAEELNPAIKLVVHIVNPRLGSYLEGLIEHCTVLSAAAMAAPEFIAAALEEEDVRWISVGGREVVAGPPELVAEPAITTLAGTDSKGSTVLLPNGDGDLVLGPGIRRQPRRVRPRLDELRADLGRMFDRRLRIVALVLAVTIAMAAVVIKIWPHGPTQVLSWPDALYLAVWTITGSGADDPRASSAAAWVRLVGVGGSLLGLVLVSLLTAAIVDMFVGESLARSLGRMRGRPRGHVVVCGLGTVGAKVAQRLHDRGFTVVAIERDEEKQGVQTARGLGIPVIIGDVSNDQILYEARLHRCRAMLAVTSDDVANLQAGLYARERNADTRIVLRLFDHDLAARVQARLGLATTRSVSMLAAPAFAQVLLERRIQATVPAGRRVLLVTEVRINAGSAMDGKRIVDLAEPGAIRVLAHRRGPAPSLGEVQRGDSSWNWNAATGTRLRAGDQVALVAGLGGLARALLATRTRTPT